VYLDRILIFEKWLLSIFQILLLVSIKETKPHDSIFLPSLIVYNIVNVNTITDCNESILSSYQLWPNEVIMYSDEGLLTSDQLWT
jgi:hypothetical protein